MLSCCVDSWCCDKDQTDRRYSAWSKWPTEEFLNLNEQISLLNINYIRVQNEVTLQMKDFKCFANPSFSIRPFCCTDAFYVAFIKNIKLA